MATKAAKRGRGRPNKLTRKIIEDFAVWMKAGHYRNVACRALGLSTRTVSSWCKMGHERPGTIYEDFVLALEQGEVQAEISITDRVLRAAQKDWRAAAWYLERRFPQHWGQRNQIELTGGGNGGPVVLKVIEREIPTRDEATGEPSK